MAKFIEARHEITLQRRLADVRPWTTKVAEMLSDKFTLMMWSVPVLIVSAVVPLFALFVGLPLVATLIVVHRSVRPTLPFRYPAFNDEVDPKSKKPGDGIMFFGNQESSSPYEKFKELWGSDDDLRKHMLILGSTGSGKSETLKSLFFNSLCWSSGFFIADGKADNKLPTDVFTMARSVGRDDDLLMLNFLLAGKTPEQVRRSTRRRTNKLNPFSSTDADTIIQMGANMLPKVEGEGKNWQEKALNLWRALVVALCYKRDNFGFELSVSTLIEYMSLQKIEELYMEGYREMREKGDWSYGFISIKTYLDSGCPAYKVDKLLAKHKEIELDQPAGGFGAPRGGKANSTEQDSMAFEQHAYRTSQLMPVLNLLDKTYGHIFRDKYPEIDMVDVTLNNRIMAMLIPSLEKSAQEAENLGKLAIACLRVMMARNLGAGIEGSRADLLDSKATNAPYPYLVALDELGYYFSDGIAVIFAQARSLGFSMIPAAQDLEKLTEGSRAAEAGAMMANSVTKIFLRIDDAKKTLEFVQSILQKAMVAVYKNYEISDMGWKRKSEVDLVEMERVSMKELQAMNPGQGVMNAQGTSVRFRSYYMDGDLKKHRADQFYVLRFLQVAPPTDEEVEAASIPREIVGDALVQGEQLRSILTYERNRMDAGVEPPASEVLSAVAAASARLPRHIDGARRAIALYTVARRAILAQREQVRAASDFGTDEEMRAALALPPTAPTPAAAPAVQVPADPLAGLVAPSPAAPPRRAPSAEPWTPPETLRQPPRAEEGMQPPPPTASSLAGPEMAGEVLLDEILGPLPFRRKAVEELRAADEESTATAPGASEVEQRIIDPVDFFLGGMRGFNMPRIVEPRPDESAADAVLDAFLNSPATATTPLAQTAPPAGSNPASETVRRPSQGAGPSPFSGLASPARKPRAGRPRTDEDDWIDAAVAASQEGQVTSSPDAGGLAAPGAPAPARSAVGFTPETSKQLETLESALGNEKPEQSVKQLEVLISQQITPNIAPEVSLDDLDVLALIDDFDGKFGKKGASS